jgi:hypothetical protein
VNLHKLKLKKLNYIQITQVTQVTQVSQQQKTGYSLMSASGTSEITSVIANTKAVSSPLPV